MRHLMITLSILCLPLLGAAQFQHIQINSGLSLPLEGHSGNPIVGNSYGAKSHINIGESNGGAILYGNVNSVPNNDYVLFYERYYMVGAGGYWALTDSGSFRLNFHTIFTNLWYDASFGSIGSTTTNTGSAFNRDQDISPVVIGFDALYQVSDRIAIGANLDYIGGSYYVAKNSDQISINRNIRLFNTALSLRYCFN